MRPTRLIMQAFGPYAETQPLEMDELGEKGIYAIIGETGTGKTTIFDAIVYALYGTGSGEDRADGKSLRAAAARPNLETKVELEFLCGGKTYKIVRKPTQFLTGKRTKDLVKYDSSVELTMPDGTKHTDSKEIDGTREKPGIIERDILGVNKDQFCQTVLIAQGEFRKLLRAKTDERTEILRRIFKTQRFDALSRQMDQLCKDKFSELTESRKQAVFSLNAMRAGEGTPLYDRLKAMKSVKAEELLLQDALVLATELTSEDDAELEAALKARREAESARDYAKQAYDRATEMQKKRQRRIELAGELEQQKTNFENAEQQRKEAEAKRPEISALNDQIAGDRLLLPKYTDLEKQEADRRQLEGGLRLAEISLKEAAKKETELKQERELLAKEANTLVGAGDRKLEASRALRDAQDRGKQLNTLYERINQRETAQRILCQSKKALTAAEERAKNALQALNALINERDALGNTAQTVTRLENEERTLGIKATEIARMKQLSDDLSNARLVYAIELKAYEKYKKDWEQLAEEAHQMRILCNASIAGLWARDLQEGTPCPVCGCKHHPNPAVLIEKPVTEEEVSRAEAQAEEARSIFSDQAKKCSAKQEAADGLRRQLAEILGGIPEADWPEEINSQKRKNQEALALLTGELKKARAADKHYQMLQASEPKTRQAAETAQGEKHTKESDVRAAEESLKSAEKEVSAAAHGLMPECWTALDLSDAISECDALQKALLNTVKKAEADVQRAAQIEARQNQLIHEQNNATEAARNADRNYSDLKARLEERIRSCDTLRRELPWATEAECLAAINRKIQNRDDMEQAIRTSANHVEELGRNIANLKGELKALETDLAKAPEEDPEALKAEYQTRQNEYETADKQKSIVEGRRTNNAEQHKALKAYAEAAIVLEREYRVMKDVADTANGRVKSQDRITLETYVQTAYFDRIVAYANQRLTHMSRQQYDLARQIVGEGSKQGKTGLDLDVIDHVNGQRRAVSTLSGGEGFLAALSFALGLSDAIQDNATSAVQLDAMFVDEGFGSLSDNYLRLVMDELNDTANTGHRLIGIISHVDEVKDGIDRRIEVTKSDNGISTAEIHSIPFSL